MNIGCVTPVWMNLKKHDDDGPNDSIKQELEKLISRNNYAGIYNDIAPTIRFIVKIGV